MDRSKWEYKKLEDLCEVITKGTTPTTLGYNFVEKGVNFVKIENISTYGKLLKDRLSCISEDCNQSMSRSQLQEKDLLFSIAGALGRIYIVEKSLLPANTNQALAIIRLKEKNDLFIQYLSLFLNSNSIKRQIEKNKVGVAQLNLSLGQIKNFTVPIPSTTEQLKIVSEIDCLNEMIAVKQEQLKEFDKLAQSIFYDMFGDPLHDSKWDKVVLGNVCKTTSGGTPSKNNSSYYDGGNIGWLRSGDITTHIWENKAFITKEGMDNSSAKMFPVNTVVVAMYGATVGQVGILHIETTTNQAVCGIFPNNSFNPVYLCYHFMCVKPLLIKSAIGGAQPNISQCLIKSLRVPLPPLALQQQFADKISAIEAQKELVKQSIAETQALLDYTMDYYFNE